MSEQEKKDQPQFYVMGGYLKVNDYKKAWANLWAILPRERKNMLTSIPEFDAQIFKDITGIDVTEDTARDDKKAKILAKIEELRKEADQL